MASKPNNHEEDSDQGRAATLSIDERRHRALRRLLNSVLLCYALLFPMAVFLVSVIFGSPKTNSIAATSAMSFAIIMLLMFFGMPLLAMIARHFAIRLNRNKPRVITLTLAHVFGLFGIVAAYAIWALLIPEAASLHFSFIMPGLTIAGTVMSFYCSIVGELIGVRLTRLVR